MTRRLDGDSYMPRLVRSFVHNTSGATAAE
jgi:hypothetical protein